MTKQQEAVIAGCVLNGSGIEQIYFEMELDKENISVVEVQKVIESIRPVFENERQSILQEFKEKNILQ